MSAEAEVSAPRRATLQIPPPPGNPFGRGLARWRVLTGLALSMLFHDRMKLLGALVGVVFATVLSGQQMGTFLGLMYKNTMLIDNADADVWIVPAGSQELQAGPYLPEAKMIQARAVEGVAWADPLLWVGASVKRPEGGTETVSLLGIDPRDRHGLPWNVVVGSPDALAQPGAVFFEQSRRTQFGNLNIGSLREMNGHKVQAVGFTSGLLPFGPSFAFADYDLARTVAGQRSMDPNMVLIGVREGYSPEDVAAKLREQVTDVQIYSKSEFHFAVIRYILTRTPIGITFGVATAFALIVGFVIVSLTMFSAVVDNIREFGTLKAIGATTWDLARILIVQAAVYALVGSGIGLTWLGFIAGRIRSPLLTLMLPPWLVFSLPLFMLTICIIASGLALIRLRNLEPAIVFRG